MNFFARALNDLHPVEEKELSQKSTTKPIMRVPLGGPSTEEGFECSRVRRLLVAVLGSLHS